MLVVVVCGGSTGGGGGGCGSGGRGDVSLRSSLRSSPSFSLV